jgi:nitroreductase
MDKSCTPSQIETIIKQRYSERSFTEDPVPMDEVVRMIEVSLNAPSPSGRNPFYFVLIQEKRAIEEVVAGLQSEFDKLKERLSSDPAQLKTVSYYERYSLFIEEASQIILCYTNERKSALSFATHETDGEAANLLSLGAVLQNMGLLFTTAGIGHCILSAAVELFPEFFDRTYPAPPHLKLRCMVAVGRPASAGRDRPKSIRTERYVKVIGR